VICALLALAAGCGGGDSTVPDLATETFATSLGVNISAMTKVSSSLYIQDVVVGTGAVVSAPDSISVTYTGWLANGTQFDSNVGRSPLGFSVGVGRVIAGWDQGLIGMRVGGTRRLVIGSALGYGSQGYAPAIPPNATLVFQVQLLSLFAR
jgi:FKBP-type peptidyl-prolyl cis-trans isomerase